MEWIFSHTNEQISPRFPLWEFVTLLKFRIQKEKGHPNVCSFLIFSRAFNLEKMHKEVWPLPLNLVVFKIRVASSRVNGHRSMDIVSGQKWIARRRINLVLVWRCPILLSATPFWQWAFALHRNKFWWLESQAVLKPASLKCPVSPIQCWILTPWLGAHGSNPNVVQIVESRVQSVSNWEWRKGGLQQWSVEIWIPRLVLRLVFQLTVA